MIPALKSEFRKIFTVRSTYGVLFACFLLVFTFSFVAQGYNALPATLHDPSLLANDAVSATDVLGIFGAIIAVLLVSYEYRYNLINYTLTATKRRSTIVFAKFLALSVVAVLFGLCFAALSPLLTYAGMHLKGLELVHQNIPYLSLLWRSLFSSWAYFMFGFIIALLVRSQVGSLVVMFGIAWPLQGLLPLLFKGNSKYLPYNALNNIAIAQGGLSYGKSAFVVLAYIVVVGIIATIFFDKRDAS